MILVSACLLGVNCRYDGGNCRNEAVIEYLKAKEYLAICPEELGGLPTPRPASEIVGDKVWTISGEDVTAAFARGAQTVLKMAQENNCELAILKSESPSCGQGLIFDGSFSAKLIVGNGITVQLLQLQGIEVRNEKYFSLRETADCNK